MSLSAMVDGDEVLAFTLAPHALEALGERLRRGQSTARLGCGHPAVLRKSPRLLPYFEHGSAPCDVRTGPVSGLAAAAAIYWAVKAAGWQARVHGLSDDGQCVEVEARRGDVTVGVAVAWASPAPASVRSAMASVGQATAWLVRDAALVPAAADPDRPVFLLGGDEKDGFTVDTGLEAPVSLSEAVGALLGGRLRFVDSISAVTAAWTVSVYSERCYGCNGSFSWWRVSVGGRSSCGRPLALPVQDAGLMTVEWRPEAHPVVARTLRSLPVRAPWAQPRLRESVSYGRTYLAFSCPSCDALLSDGFLTALAERMLPEQSRVVTVDWPVGVAGPHWCHGDDPCWSLQGFAAPALA